MFLNPPPLPENISTPPEYNLNPSEKSQPLPKKSQPLPKKLQPLSKKSQPLPKKSQPGPQKIANPSRKNVTSTEKFNPSRLNPLLRKFFIPPLRKFLNSAPKISQTPRKFCNPPPR